MLASDMAKTLTSILIVAAVVPTLASNAALAAPGKSAPADTSKATALSELRSRRLVLPVLGVSIERLKDSFRDRRGESRRHNAIDILAPRGTPVVSADSGRILKLYRNNLGGLMVYASDAEGRYIYSYAHLDRYRPGLREGAQIARGDTLGYVGTTGNAPADIPHLHFAILRSNNVKRWSRGTPVNPFEVFKSPPSDPEIEFMGCE
jgi:murein DD-endopeptidase MepM/ murein hydrolase activator NlpD